MHLNGPVVQGFGVLIETDEDEVLIVAPSAAVAEGIAAYLGGQARATEVRVGQPPYYQNTTRDYDFDDVLKAHEPKRPRQRSLLDEAD